MIPSKSTGQRYIDFISQKPTEVNDTQWALLFSTTIKKIVNSSMVCSDRNQLINQMIDVEKKYGTRKIQLMELIESNNPLLTVIRFEMTWTDGTVDTVIAILKADENGLIEEINEVFGEKAAYQWQP